MFNTNTVANNGKFAQVRHWMTFLRP